MTAMFFHPDREELLVEFLNGATAKISIEGNSISVQAKQGAAFLNPNPTFDYGEDEYLMSVHVKVLPR